MEGTSVIREDMTKLKEVGQAKQDPEVLAKEAYKADIIEQLNKISSPSNAPIMLGDKVIPLQEFYRVDVKCWVTYCEIVNWDKELCDLLVGKSEDSRALRNDLVNVTGLIDLTCRLQLIKTIKGDY